MKRKHPRILADTVKAEILLKCGNWISIEELQKEFNYKHSQTTLTKYISELLDTGHLDIKYDKARFSSVYRVKPEIKEKAFCIARKLMDLRRMMEKLIKNGITLHKPVDEVDLNGFYDEEDTEVKKTEVTKEPEVKESEEQAKPVEQSTETETEEPKAKEEEPEETKQQSETVEEFETKEKESEEQVTETKTEDDTKPDKETEEQPTETVSDKETETKQPEAVEEPKTNEEPENKKEETSDRYSDDIDEKLIELSNVIEQC